MRKTLFREIQKRDQVRVLNIVDALADAPNQELGDAQMARAAGLSWCDYKQRKISKSIVDDLMPFIDEQVALRYPGNFVDRPGGGLAKISSDPDRCLKQGMGRLHKVATSLSRVADEFGPLRYSINPLHQRLVARVDLALDSLTMMEKVHAELVEAGDI